MTPSNSAHTSKALLHSTALLFALCLLIQIPVVAKYGQQPLAWKNLLFHFVGAMSVVVFCQYNRLPLARITLLICYYSYVVSATLIWQKDVYIQHFLLLGSLCSVFLFAQHERYARLLWGIGFAITFCALDIQLSFALPNWEGAVRRGNSITLAIACVSVMISLHYHTRTKWQRLSYNYRKTRGMLVKMTPAAQLLSFATAQSRQRFSLGCVFFADIKGYQKLTALFDESRIIDNLDSFYSHIDKEAKRHNMLPIKTNGDEYMAVSGLDDTKVPAHQHINNSVLFAFSVINAFTAFAALHQWPCQIRIGLAAGPITAGMPKRDHGTFDVWGNTVNMASMLEQAACANAIVISDTVFAQISKKNKAYFLPIEVTTKMGKFNAFSYSSSINKHYHSKAAPYHHGHR